MGWLGYRGSFDLPLWCCVWPIPLHICPISLIVCEIVTWDVEVVPQQV